MGVKRCIRWIIVKTPAQRQLNNNSTKVGFDMKMTLYTTPPPPHPPQKLNVRNISAVTDLLSNFKPRFLGLSRTDFNRRSIICPYQEYLSCYLPNFEKTLKVGSWDYLEQIPSVTVTFVQATFVHIRNISAVNDLILMQL